jgi:multimeric flavodoxin WrbA
MNKRILSIIASPRKEGNTSLMSDILLEKLEGLNWEFEKLFLIDYEIGSCTDCRACKKNDLICTVDDGMQEIYEHIECSDVIVFGTPIYWFGPTAQMKALMDRFRPYFYNGKLKGKKACLLLPAGSGKKDCDLTIEMFKRMCAALEMPFLGAVTAEAYDEGDVKNNQSVMKAIGELSEAIVNKN